MVMASTTPPKKPSKTNFKIDLLGASITISADKEVEYLNRIVEHYKLEVEKTQKMSGLDNPLKIAILTGFLLCEEQLKHYARQASEEELNTYEDREIETLALRLIARIDEVLEKGAR